MRLKERKPGKMRKFLSENSSEMKLARTIVQGVIGVLVSNVDIILGTFSIDPTIKPVITALVMAVLTPIMSELGKKG